MKAITLVETRRGMQICETTPRYDVFFRGKFFDQLYFNMRGYVGYLPCPSDNKDMVAKLHIGERGISAYKKEITTLNKEWAKLPDVKME